VLCITRIIHEAYGRNFIAFLPFGLLSNNRCSRDVIKVYAEKGPQRWQIRTENFSTDATIGSNIGKYPPAQIRYNCGMMVQQAVERFMNRLSLATSIPAGISDVQHQGHELQAVALSPLKSLSSQSESSSLELEPLANSISAGKC
jgi:hypothetical protein